MKQPLIRERIDTVRPTGLKMDQSGGVDIIPVDDMLNELLLKIGFEVPTVGSHDMIAKFRLGEILGFDHRSYLESPTFLYYLEADV